MKSTELIAFGDNFIDPTAIGVITLGTDKYVRAAEGNMARDSEYGRVAFDVVSVALDLQHATPHYSSLGYESADNARKALDNFLDQIGREHFTLVGNDTWVRGDLVRSISASPGEFVVWADFQASAAPLQVRRFRGDDDDVTIVSEGVNRAKRAILSDEADTSQSC